ncbi:MAG: hypothetical protein AYL33_003420 [Candidatus Bathyarchaeota archaeon B63]|nr:MAG: hypothetical protein AYL33_003420 [Candidatus Bathyarchaeota archaeon B63]
MTDVYTLKGGYLVTPRGVFKGNLTVKDGVIQDLGPSSKPAGAVHDVDGLYVLPGFREQHMHDMPGLTRYIERPERIGEISRKLLRSGVTSFKLATVAMPTDDLLTYLGSCWEYLESGGEVEGARFEGAFVEGTFINRECAGAQPPEFIVHPNEPGARELLDACLDIGVVRLVNIVPDFGVDLIRYASSRGVLVGSGHFKASARLLREAVKAGLRFIIHLTNGAMGRSFKPFEGGGAYEGALTLPVFVELIMDGYHVDFRYVSDIIERRIMTGRAHEVIAVTDRLFPTPQDAPEGSFRMFSVVCSKPPDEDVLYMDGHMDDEGRLVRAPPFTLCGSLLTMDRAFQKMLNLFTMDHSGYMIDVDKRSLEDSLMLISRFTSANMADLEGLTDVGTLQRGKRADISVLEIEGEPGRYGVKVKHTIVDGDFFEI